MLDQSLTLPEDPEELRSFTARLLAEVKAQAILIEKLRHQLAGHRARRFGASSATAEQLQLALESEPLRRHRLEPNGERDCRRRDGGADASAGHRGEGQTQAPPDPRPHSADGGGTQHHCRCLHRLRRAAAPDRRGRHGRAGIRPRALHREPHRAAPPDLRLARERFVQVPLPSRPIERGRPGPGLLAHVLVSRYADHLPLCRQSQIFDREGLNLDRSTLADWVGKTTALLEPLADAIGRHVRLYRAHGPLSLRRDPRGRLYGPCAAQVCRHPPLAGLTHRPGGHRTDRPAICRRKGGSGVPPDRRAELRRAHAAPILDDLEIWLAMQLTTISGKSPLAAAIRYVLSQMERLRPYLDHGILELDSNPAERGMRAIALGRKNHLFVGSEAGGKAAAIAYTLSETAKLNAVNPHAWLADTIARIPDYKITKLDDLMPWHWNA